MITAGIKSIKCMETKTASEMWDIMEELGIAVDKSFIEPCD